MKLDYSNTKSAGYENKVLTVHCGPPTGRGSCRGRMRWRQDSNLVLQASDHFQHNFNLLDQTGHFEYDTRNVQCHSGRRNAANHSPCNYCSHS